MFSLLLKTDIDKFFSIKWRDLIHIIWINSIFTLMPLSLGSDKGFFVVVCQYLWLNQIRSTLTLMFYSILFLIDKSPHFQCLPLSKHKTAFNKWFRLFDRFIDSIFVKLYYRQICCSEILRNWLQTWNCLEIPCIQRGLFSSIYIIMNTNAN